MQSIAPEGRAKGTMNLDSDPKNPVPVPALRAPCTSSRKSEFLKVPYRGFDSIALPLRQIMTPRSAIVPGEKQPLSEQTLRQAQGER